MKEDVSLMEVEVDRRALLKVLSRVRKVMDSKSLPILSAVLLTTEENKVRVDGTNLDLWFQDFTPARVITPGSMAIPITRLSNFVKEINSFAVTIKGEEHDWVGVSGRTSQFRFAGYPVGDFPIMTEQKDTVMMEIEGKVLAEMIDKVIYATKDDDDVSRWNLSGVFMEMVSGGSEDFLRMVAMDGYRLALIDRGIPGIGKLGLGEGILLSKSGLTVLHKLFLTTKQSRKRPCGFGFLNEETVFLGVNEPNLIVRKGSALLLARLLDGEFPDYKELVFGNKGGETINVDRKLLLGAMKRMSLTSSSEFGGTYYDTVKMNIGIDYIEMASENSDLSMKERIGVIYTGEPLEVVFVPKYFIDILQVMDSNVVNIRITGQWDPCFVTGEQDDGFLGLIMPKRQG